MKELALLLLKMMSEDLEVEMFKRDVIEALKSDYDKTVNLIKDTISCDKCDSCAGATMDDGGCILYHIMNGKYEHLKHKSDFHLN